ncbi:TMV resistance protein N [Glycine soja]
MAETFSGASRYDVFINFRGEDTRHGFTGHLYDALRRKGIRAFMDENDIQRGEEIRTTLEEAIKGSRIAITVLSKDYASSSFCLNELETILGCYRENNTLLFVIPVFYKVDPSDVRHQRGSYAEGLASLEERFHPNMEKWRTALQEVTYLAGFPFKDGAGYEFEFIGKIVDDVFRKINEAEASISVADGPVGLDSQVDSISRFVDPGSSDAISMIGIHGMGGVGKSTLARHVYNLYKNYFHGSCFLQNVREESNRKGLKHLQSILLLQIFNEDINLASEQQGTSMIKNKLRGKKVLLVLDDVDEHKQLQAFVEKSDWESESMPGTRVVLIITTRDKQLLTSYGVEITHEVGELSETDAIELLKRKAFNTYDESYRQVLKDVVTWTSRLPLALEVIGSNLFEKSIEEWESAIKQYQRIPNKKILKILRVSFDALEEEEKSVFLDIICCLKGYKWRKIQYILHQLYDNCMKYHIGVLLDKSLIKIRDDDEVMVHDLIENMGKEIDRQESPKEAGKRRRLWLQKDIIQVLKDNSGTGEVKIIRLDFPIYDKQEKIEWDGNALKEMKNLKALIIRNGILSQAPNYLPESLRIFEWHTSFASLAYATSNSSIPPLGCGGISKARFWIPDASGLSNLKEFSFEYCENLIIVHESIDSIFQQTNLHSGIIILNFFLLMAKTCSDASIYDVFINFRGEDTRYEFMTHLHRAFRDKGIRAFMDEEDLKGGDKITTKLKGGDYKC